MPLPALAEFEHRARARGIDLIGLVDAQRFDGSQPHEGRCARLRADCGTAIVVASGRPQPVPVGALDELAALLRGRGIQVAIAVPPRSGVSLPCLGEAAGLGIVSPVIHRLLHPQFGPWVTVHGALLLSGRPFGAIADASIADAFHPCCQCARPCLPACPAGVHDGRGPSRFDRCHDHRSGGGCGSSCSVVRACPVGAPAAGPVVGEAERHRLETAQLAFRHARGVFAALRRWLGD